MPLTWTGWVRLTKLSFLSTFLSAVQKINLSNVKRMNSEEQVRSPIHRAKIPIHRIENRWMGRPIYQGNNNRFQGNSNWIRGIFNHLSPVEYSSIMKKTVSLKFGNEMSHLPNEWSSKSVDYLSNSGNNHPFRGNIQPIRGIFYHWLPLEYQSKLMNWNFSEIDIFLFLQQL